MSSIVIKKGGSVLVDDSSYQRAASQLIDLSKKYNNVTCVVSARKGKTDELILNYAKGDREKAAFLNSVMKGDPFKSDINLEEQKDIASALIQGEYESAIKLFNILYHEGIDASLHLQGHNFPIVSDSNHLCANILEEETENRIKNMKKSKIAIVSGFGAEDLEGNITLLGRNASDVVGAVLARYDPDVSIYVLSKDVGGVYKDFGTPKARLIKELSIAELASREFNQVICDKVIPHIQNFSLAVCSHRLLDPLNAGTIIRGYH